MSPDLKNKLFNETECISEQTMYDYIDKKLLPKEEHLVEKHLLDCEMCSDAIEGMRLQHNRNSVKIINKKIDERLNPKETKIIYFNYKTISAIAASLALLIGSIIFFKQFTQKESKQSDIAILTPAAEENTKTYNEKANEPNVMSPTESTARELKDNISKEETGKAADIKQETNRNQLNQPDNTTTVSSVTSVQSGSGIKDEEANAEGNYKYTTSGDDLSKKRADSKSEKDKEQYYFSTDATTTPPSTAAENKSNTVYSKNKNTEDKKAEAPQKSLEETAVQKNDKNYTRTNNTEKEIGGKKEEKKSTKKIKNKPSAAAGNGSVANEQQQPKETTTETVYDLDGLTANDSVSTSIVYENPEIPALFPGGNDSLSKYIFKNFKLPSDYRSENLSGTKIYVQFIIDTEGKVQKAKIVKGINPAYDTEALRIINAMPKWKPAKQNGKTVNSKITLPIQLEIK